MYVAAGKVWHGEEGRRRQELDSFDSEPWQHSLKKKGFRGGGISLMSWDLKAERGGGDGLTAARGSESRDWLQAEHGEMI